MGQDEELKTERLDFLGLKDEEGARHLMALGHAWATRNAPRIDAHFAAVPRSAAAPWGTTSRWSHAQGGTIHPPLRAGITLPYQIRARTMPVRTTVGGMHGLFRASE